MFSRIGAVKKVNRARAPGLLDFAVRSQMPTVFQVRPYRLFFYSADGGEPPHIHIERDDRIAKYWLSPVRLGRSSGFSARDLRDIERIVAERETALLEAWHDYFDA
jgi:hypothetical protein